MPFQGAGWTPTRCIRSVRYFQSALRTALVETDLGYGYLKGLGNPEGPHALACELIGTSLAEWLGVPTLDYSLVGVAHEDEIPTSAVDKVAAGPAFISRREEYAFTWGGSGEMLANIVNSEAISELVVLDTWLRNCDRHAPDGRRRNLDNVMLIKEPASRRALRLVAMDFTHAFTCGAELTRRMNSIDYVQDRRIYGLFREFHPWLDRVVVGAAAAKLGGITTGAVQDIVNRVPQEWQLSEQVRAGLIGYVTDRARFLAINIEHLIWTQMNLIMETENGN